MMYFNVNVKVLGSFYYRWFFSLFEKGFYCDSGNSVITTVRKFLTHLNLTQFE